MKRRELLLHLSVIAFSTAWEFLLLYNMIWLGDYYIESRRVYIRDGIPACWFWYSPSLPFVFLVLLPAIVFLVIYVRFKEPLLKKSGLAIGLSVLSVVLVSLLNPKGSFLVLLAISAGVGAILGKRQGRKGVTFPRRLFAGIYRVYDNTRWTCGQLLMAIRR